AVNRELHPDEVDVDAFVDDRVVQGMKDAIPDSGLEQGPPLEAEVTRRPAIERAPLLTELHLGEEAEASGIDPEHRNIGDGRLLGGPEHRPIAADTDDQSGAVEVADQRSGALLGRRAVGPDTKTALLEPAARG